MLTIAYEAYQSGHIVFTENFANMVQRATVNSYAHPRDRLELTFTKDLDSRIKQRVETIVDPEAFENTCVTLAITGTRPQTSKYENATSLTTQTKPG